MGVSFRYDPQTGQFKKYFVAAGNIIKFAANTAVFETALVGVRAGRASIAGAGFSKRWQSSLRFKMITPKDSLKPLAYIHTTINYADVFEKGKDIKGSDTLIWLPLPSVPAQRGSGIKFGGVVGRKHMTPAQYVKNIGPLMTIRRPGKVPILAAFIKRGTKAQPFGKFATKAQLKKGLAGRGKERVMIPLFVGVKSVRIGKRFNITAALQKATNNMGQIYEDQMRKIDAAKLLQGG